jgi:hypothetical protein
LSHNFVATSTPRRTETIKEISPRIKDELQIDTSSPISTGQDDEQGETVPKEYSRRLVEYFVVVSSVPRLVANRERLGSNDCKNATIGESSDLPTTKQIDHKSLTVGTDAANGQIPPPPSRTKSAGSTITPRVAARVDKRRGHLKESFRPGESVLPALSLSAPNVMEFDDEPDIDTPAIDESKGKTIHNASSDASEQQGSVKAKSSKFSSMSEQRKKLSEQTKKLGRQASGLHHHLESKIRSISIGRSFSGDLDKGPQHQDDADDSSFSSFSIDEGSPLNNPPSVAFQPSMSPTSEKRCLTPSTQSPLRKREGGASENIRMNNTFFASPGGEFNNDIDDCILEPVITAQYPPVDRPDQPLNPMLTHFCHPQGVENIYPVHEYKMPKIHHFVLTDSKGGKLYGTCLTVWEEFNFNGKETLDDDISLASMREEEQERNYIECSINEPPTVKRHPRRSINHKYYAPRVLCLLSTWPYLSAFRTYLTQLYRLVTTTTLMQAPLERYILNICEEVPAPPPGSFEVHLSILEANIRIWAPPADQPIPYVSVNYGVLFECLDISNVLFAWNTLALERKILLVSSQVVSTSCCILFSFLHTTNANSVSV